MNGAAAQSIVQRRSEKSPGKGDPYAYGKRGDRRCRSGRSTDWIKVKPKASGDG